MAWQPSEKEIVSVSDLEASARYSHCLKKVADTGEIWSLWHPDGWALAGDPQDRECIPVWPHEAYATKCASGAWADYSPKLIPLDVWLQRWIPGMKRDNRLVAVFPTASDKGVVVDPDRIEHDIRGFLSEIE